MVKVTGGGGWWGGTTLFFPSDEVLLYPAIRDMPKFLRVD